MHDQLIFSVALRNLFRNKRRTILTMSAMSLACALLIFTLCVNEGFVWSMVISSTEDYISHVVISDRKTESEKDIHYTLREDLSLKFSSQVQAISGRLKNSMLISAGSLSNQKTRACEVLGIDIEKEPHVTKIKENLVSGTWFENPDGVVISQGLYKLLGVSLGDEVLFVGQGAKGTLATGIFRICGVFRAQSKNRNASLVLLSLKNLQQMMGLENQVHEFVLRVKDPVLARDIRDHVRKTYPDLRVLSWHDKLPQVAQILDFWGISQIIVLAIFYSAVILISVNTMSMSILERNREFAILRAIGFSKTSVFVMVCLEGTIMSVLSAFFGLLIGGFFSWLVYENPVDLSYFMKEVSWGGATILPKVRAWPTFQNHFLPFFTMCFLGFFTSLWPSFKLLSGRIARVLAQRS